MLSSGALSILRYLPFFIDSLLPSIFQISPPPDQDHSRRELPLKHAIMAFHLLALPRSNDRQEALETVRPHSRSIPGFLLDLHVSTYSCLCGCIVRACRRVAFDSGTVHCFHVRNKFCMDQVSLMLRVLFCIDSSLIGSVWKPSEVASNLFWMFVPIFAVLHCFFRA